ncbi:TPA: hypothetical protein ACUU9M_004179 [Yersinia enterocolitica]|uniref:hypothetical protein n=2 Tax=Yersiniaceae TaxID=1903411 RepID=UPI001124D88A|nr:MULTISPECIES: hypothetical protein [Yersinia]HDL6649089.1 hypothetical protein [Yersinia enterocolitica]HEB0973831.1 hypothetical protein [Yersinia enterocolitica]HEB1850828.1 hypothetical protein [Yersinia enterocolitica]HEG7104094.1 hypothetical protein [Yersinia enterocolitica]HEN3534217.1 hypothetical protein [Yersinia enterocolitica]
MYYINDLTKKKSILRIKSSQDAKTFLTWAKEYSPSCDFVISDNYISVIESELSLEYFGFSIESFCTLLITLKNKKSSLDSNHKLLFETLLKKPNDTIYNCAINSGVNATHAYRPINQLKEYCAKTSSLTGGRNPFVFFTSVRNDLS